MPMIPWRKNKKVRKGPVSYASVMPNAAGQYYLVPHPLDGSFTVYFLRDPLVLGRARKLAEAKAMCQRHYDEEMP